MIDHRDITPNDSLYSFDLFRPSPPAPRPTSLRDGHPLIGGQKTSDRLLAPGLRCACRRRSTRPPGPLVRATRAVPGPARPLRHSPVTPAQLRPGGRLPGSSHAFQVRSPAPSRPRRRVTGPRGVRATPRFMTRCPLTTRREVLLFIKTKDKQDKQTVGPGFFFYS